MFSVIRCCTLLIALAIVLPVAADDQQKKTTPPDKNPTYRSAGQIVGELSKSDGNSVSLKMPDLDRAKATAGKSRSARPRIEYKDHAFDLVADAKIRWHSLPKGLDGKPKQYTKDEYQKLLEPLGAPGYKADLSDLHAGQTVRLYLARAGKDSDLVATTVVILAEPAKKPAAAEKSGKAGKGKGK